MDQSDSQLSVSQLSLSLSWPSRLAPVVGAAGVHWVSQVPSNVFGTCHALRPRQVSGNLTIAVSSVLGSGDATPSPPACLSIVSRLDCFSEVRPSLAACACPCVRFQEFVRLSALFIGGLGLSWLPATLGLGWLVRPSHPVLSLWATVHVFVLSCMFSLEGLSPSTLLSFTCGAPHLDTTAGRCGPKSEMRNPKPETNSNAQWSKAKNRQQGSGFGHSLLGAWGLFRASSFGFRVSALWMAVVPRCAPASAGHHLWLALGARQITISP